MSAQSPSTFDRLVELTGKAIERPQQVQRIVEAIEVTSDAIKTIATSRVEQERIRANARVEIEQVHLVRDALLSYLDRSFDERKRVFEELFARLDRALETGRIDVVATTLDAIVEVASRSPFKDLADASKAHEILKKQRDFKL